MTRWLFGTLQAVVFASAVLISTGVQALITGGYGNDPLADRDWPAGTLAIANHKSRLGWWEGPPFGGGKYTFLYRGDAKAFNEMLALLAKINCPKVELHVHRGPHDDFWLVDRSEQREGEKKQIEKKRAPRIDWSFTVWTPRNFHHLFNNPTSLILSSDQPEFRTPVPPPQIDVYLGGGLIDWKDVKVPEKVRVVGNPGEVLKDEAPRVRLHVYDMLTSKPIKGATVKLVGHDQAGEKEAARQTADEAGAADFDKLTAGTYELRLEAEGYAPRSLGWQQYGNGDVKDIAAELSPVAVLAGRVVNSQNKPIAGATVRTFVVVGLDGRGYTQRDRPEAKTDDEGRFELKLPTGYVQLSAQAAGLYHSWTDVVPVGDRRPAVSPDEPVIIRMVQTTSVAVTVTDQTGKPIPGQSVHLEPVGNPIGKWGGSATTNDKGRAVIEGVPPGGYRITDRAYEAMQSKEISVEEGRALETKVSW
jgi:5-hydroxyisourate hydrolase-like protein (transthyretin family)